MSESTPLCSGSRGFSSVNCCSFIPAILDSNLQSPWQHAEKDTSKVTLAFHHTEHAVELTLKQQLK